ncbi:MAG: polysaccharide biosynthesis protein [Planctomycetes bacterium]|nr:polysaccharide biosynthesis protein [Planctomycetota bacterium]
MSQTAIIIGLPETCRRLERQLDLLPQRPVTLGWVLAEGDSPNAAGESRHGDPEVLGVVSELEAIVARRRPDVALVALPSVMSRLIATIRTRLRRLGVPDRFMPTLEDQIAGIGPRSQLEVDLASLLDRKPRSIDEQAVRRVIQSKRVLITGAGGSIGSELARIVCRFNARELILVDRAENALFEIDRQIARLAQDLPRRAVLHDVVDAEATLKHFRRLRPAVVFHAAAHKHVPMMEGHPAAAVDNNLFGTKSVADAADAAGTERFVLISTDKAVNPRSIMGATKRLAELYVQHINQRSPVSFSMVRFGNVLGSTGSVLDIWSKEIAEGGPLTVTDPGMTRYFMTVAEAAALVIQSAALVDPQSACPEVFLLDMGEPIRVVDLAHRFIALHGLEPQRPDSYDQQGGPGRVRIVFTGARPGEKLHEELLVGGEAIRPSAHPDIHIWQLPAPDPDFVEHMISVLSPQRRSPQAADVAEMVRHLVLHEQPQPAAA